MPAARLANLSVGVSADTSELSDGFTKAEREAQRFQQRLIARSAAMGSAIGSVIGNVVGGPIQEVISALNPISNFIDSVKALDAFNDLADATGASVENLSSLEEAARRTGGSFETVESTLLKFNKQLGEAGANEAGDAFRALGLDLARLKQIDAAEALRQTATALQGVEDANVRARITTILFSKGNKQAAAFLKDLAEQGRLNATVTTEQAAAAEAFNKAVATLTTEAGNAARALVSQLLPALTGIVSQLNDGIEAYGGFWAAAADIPAIDSFKNFTQNVSATRESIAALQQKIRDLNDEASKQTEQQKRWSPMEGRIGQLNEEIRLLRQREAYLLKQQARELPQAAYGHEGGLRTGTSADRPPGKDPIAEEEAKRIAKAKADAAAKQARDKAVRDEEQRVKALANYVHGLKEQALQVEKVTAVEQAMFDMETKQIQAQTQAEKDWVLSSARDADQRKKQHEEEEKAKKSATESAERLRDATRQVKEEGRAIYEAARTPLEQYTAKMERLQELYRNGHLGPNAEETYRRTAKSLDDELKNAEGAFDQLTEFSKRAAQNIQDALSDALENGFNGTLRDMAQSWLELLRKMAAQALAARLGEQMFGNGTTNKGWLGPLLQTGAQWLFNTPSAPSSGPSSSPIFAPPEAAAGIDSVPYDGFVATLHRNEGVVPAKYNTAAARSPEMNVTIQNHGADVQTRRNERGDLEVIVRNMVRDTFTSDLKTGGPMSRAQQSTYGLTRALARR